MKESFWGYWIIVLGIFVVIIMMLVSNVTTTNTQDYYLLKDVTEAALVDSVDYGYYRFYKELRINREKFVENFMRRFAESVSLSTYTIDFYDIYEAPPKVSVKVTTESGNYMVNGDSSSFDIVNRVDAVLETSGTASSVDPATSDYNKDASKRNDNSNNNTSTPSESTPLTMKEFIIKNGISLGYYTNIAGQENGSKTNLDSMKAFVCRDYVDYISQFRNDYGSEACQKELTDLYDSLPMTIKK